MNDSKVQKIISNLGIRSDDNYNNFVSALGDIHGKISSAITVAKLMADDPDGYPLATMSGDEFFSDLILGFAQSLLSEGIVGAAKNLENKFNAQGIPQKINLPEISGWEESLSSFISEYGFNEFFQDEFDDAPFFEFKDEATFSAEETAPEELGSYESDDEGFMTPDEEPDDSDYSSEAVSLFDSTSEDTKGRTDFSDDIGVKSGMWRDSLSKEQNLIMRVSTSSSFFEKEESDFNYTKRLRLADRDSVNPLNFHPMFRRLGDKATGLLLEDINGEVTALVSIDSMTAVRQSILRALDKIKDEIGSAEKDLQTASRGSYKPALEAYSEKRRIAANKLDDLASAIKRRDSYVTTLLNKEYRSKGYDVSLALRGRGYEASAFFRDKSDEIYVSFQQLCSLIVFVDIVKDTFYIRGEGIPAKFKENYSSELDAKFKEVFYGQLFNKIRGFFSRDNASTWSLSSLCSYLAKNIQRNILCDITLNKTYSMSIDRWSYSSCAVCGKNVYTRSSTSSFGGGGRGRTVDSSEYSEYEVDIHSLFRKDGSIITKEALSLDENGAEKIYVPSQSLVEKGYTEPKTWAEINKMIQSDSKSLHIEGVLRRSSAFDDIGAKKIKSSVPIYSLRYRCPYSSEGDRQDALSSVLMSSDGSRKPAVSGGCGLSISAGSAIDSMGIDGSLTYAQATAADNTDSPLELLTDSLDEAISSGAIDEAYKESIIEEFTRKSAGGWKFSNKFFNCPTKIDIPEEHRNEDSFRNNQYLKKYNYIASPISGPIREGSISRSEDSPQEVLSSSEVYPPLSSLSHSPADIENGTLTYLVCGAKTSLSSFSKDPMSERSLPNLIKSLMAKALEGNDPSVMVRHLVETLLTMGVDVSDIIPFIENFESPQKAVEDLDKKGRLEGLSGILAVAMASPVNLNTRVKDAPRSVNLNYMDVLGEVELVCRHGHKFRVKDSVYFGATHTGINLRNKRRNQYETKSIVGSGALFSSGADNFSKSFNMLDSNRNRFIQVVDEADLIGNDKSRKFLYQEWENMSDDIKRLIFKGPDGLNYSYSSVPRAYLWGVEGSKIVDGRLVRNKFTTIKERETVDPATTRYTDALSKGRSHTTADDGTELDSVSQATRSIWGDEDSALDEGVGSAPIIANAENLRRIIISFMTSINHWLSLSTSMEVRGPIMSGLNPMDADGNSLIMINASKAISAFVDHVYSGDDYEEAYSQSSAYFKEKYLPRFDGVAAGFAATMRPGIEMSLYVGIADSVLSAIGQSMIDEDMLASAIQSGTLTDDFYEIQDEAGVSIRTFVDEVLAGMQYPELPKLDRDRVLYDPLAVAEKGDWADTKVVEGKGVGPAIAKLKGKQYMGRVLEASSAMYLADILCLYYNTYMAEKWSNGYIGFDIGVDLSTIDKVLSISRDGDFSIIKSIDKELFQGLMEGKEAKEFYADNYDNLKKCISCLKDSMYSLRTACTSSKYMDLATEYIRTYLSEILNETGPNEDPSSVEKARKILDTVMTNKPFTTINLGTESKYRRYFGGIDSQRPESMMPVFGANLVRLNSDKTEYYYPIYQLAIARGEKHFFKNFSIDLPLNSNECYVLSSKKLPNSVELTDMEGSIPKSFFENNWRIYSVTLGRGSDEYTAYDGAKDGVSTASHPGTRAVTSHSGKIIGYRNDDLNINTSESLFVGNLGVKNGLQQLFPPHPYKSISTAGLRIPMDFKGISPSKMTDIKSGLFPIVSTRVPVDIRVSSSDTPEAIDISDFLMRSPPDEAYRIIKEIDRVYEMYLHEARKIKSSFLRERRVAEKDPAKLAAIDRLEADRLLEKKSVYKPIVASLHETYKNLPLYVKTGKISTESVAQKHSGSDLDLSEGRPGESLGQSRSATLSASTSAYVPMISWPIMHRMLKFEHFGPEWGGHQLWSSQDAGQDRIASVREALDRFIIEVNGLDVLAKEIGAKVGREIDPLDLLDPDNRLFAKGIIPQDKVSKLFFGYVANSSEKPLVTESTPWSYAEADKKSLSNAASRISNNFPGWTKGATAAFSLGRSTKDKSGIADQPSSYIKVMNTVFPSNMRAKGESLSPREQLDRVRSSDYPDILSVNHLYSTDLMHGDKNSNFQAIFPTPGDEKSLAEYKKKLKKSRHISVVRYAEAISEYLRVLVKYDLEALESDDYLNKRSLSRFGLVKFSEKLNANLYYGTILDTEELGALWDLINK